ncbi:hypothetical protein CYMTET_33529, partial [Cymbomonas tetramitiformis]
AEGSLPRHASEVQHAILQAVYTRGSALLAASEEEERALRRKGGEQSDSSATCHFPGRAAPDASSPASAVRLPASRSPATGGQASIPEEQFDDALAVLARVAYHHHVRETRDMSFESVTQALTGGASHATSPSLALWERIVKMAARGFFPLLRFVTRGRAGLGSEGAPGDRHVVRFVHIRLQQYLVSREAGEVMGRPRRAHIGLPLPDLAELMNNSWWMLVTQMGDEILPDYYTRIVKYYATADCLLLRGENLTKHGVKRLVSAMLAHAMNLKELVVLGNAVEEEEEEEEEQVPTSPTSRGQSPSLLPALDARDPALEWDTGVMSKIAAGVQKRSLNAVALSLQLTHVGISSTGTEELAQVLKVASARLTGLGLAKNDIGSHGAASLASGLVQNSSLLRLNLARNHTAGRRDRKQPEQLVGTPSDMLQSFAAPY